MKLLSGLSGCTWFFCSVLFCCLKRFQHQCDYTTCVTKSIYESICCQSLNNLSVVHCNLSLHPFVTLLPSPWIQTALEAFAWTISSYCKISWALALFEKVGMTKPCNFWGTVRYLAILFRVLVLYETYCRKLMMLYRTL